MDGCMEGLIDGCIDRSCTTKQNSNNHLIGRLSPYLPFLDGATIHMQERQARNTTVTAAVAIHAYI